MLNTKEEIRNEASEECGRVPSVDKKTKEAAEKSSTGFCRSIDLALACYFKNKDTEAVVTDTRVNDLADGIIELYRAVTKIDDNYLLTLAKDKRFKCIVQVANLLPELEQSINSEGSRDLYGIYKSDEDKDSITISNQVFR
tara:strand:- start:1374 stop:1796 length:423 start_codon:yes stop_codon:yes gene_type:complete